MTPREKAKQITEFLFTSATGRKAARLVLIDADGQDMGGWGEQPMAGWIEKMLSGPKERQPRDEGEGSLRDSGPLS